MWSEFLHASGAIEHPSLGSVATRTYTEGRMGNSRRKPTGINGMIHVRSGGLSEFMPRTLPQDKASIESFMMEGALRALESSGLDVYHLTRKPVQLSEDNFDFELPTATGTDFLDLIEFAPLQNYGGSYENAPNKHNVGQLADQAWELIKKKSRKYGGGRRVRVHLLMYATDFRFLFSDSVVALLTLWCARRYHAFRSVVYYVPIGTDSGMARVLHPGIIPETLLTAGDEHRLRNRELTNLDPRQFQPTPDGAGIQFKQGV
jgi:hypothetical protein